MKVCIYESNWTRFYPVAHVRPVFELVCGHDSLRAKIEQYGLIERIKQGRRTIPIARKTQIIIY